MQGLLRMSGSASHEIIRDLEKSLAIMKDMLKNALGDHTIAMDLNPEEKEYVRELKEVIYDAEDLLDEFRYLKVRYPLSSHKKAEINQLREKIKTICIVGRDFGFNLFEDLIEKRGSKALDNFIYKRTNIWDERDYVKEEYHMCCPLEERKYFEFCSILPRDYVIEEQALFNMWLAHGYLDPSNTHHAMEDFVQNRCSMPLSFPIFEGIEKGEHDQFISFKLADLMHDIVQEEAGEQFLMLTDTNAHLLNKKIRHLSISKHASLAHLFAQRYPAIKTLRTIFNLGQYVPCSSKHVAAILSQCVRLRLLDLHGASIEALPNTFDKVPLLRFLDLSHNEKLEKLPASITKLRCLQTLRLQGCTNLRELPKDIQKLVSLINLDIDGCHKLTSMPPGMNKLTCLRTLTMFVMGVDDSEITNIGKLTNVKALVNLRGRLQIKVGKNSLRSILSVGEGPYILKDAHLRALEINFADSFSDQIYDHETLLKSLYPNHDISKITIHGYLGTQLSTITLSRLRGSQHLTTLSQLRHLKYLRLVKLWNVESIEGDVPSESTSRATRSMTFFPSLKKLVLEEMPLLKGWWRDLTWIEMESSGGCFVDRNGYNVDQSSLPAFPLLCDLSIRLCPSMTYFPRCPRIKRLELRGVNERLSMQESYEEYVLITMDISKASGNSVVSKSRTCRETNSGLEKLIVYYDAKVFDSLFQKSVVSYAIDIELKYISQEESLHIASEGFRKCSSSLKRLSIDGFHTLKSLSRGGIEHLTSLHSLSIAKCLVLDLEEVEEGEEEGMPWKALHSLISLRLDDIPKLVNLPKGFRYLTALQSLHIKSCSNLEALGECFPFLTSLESLHIEDCNSLQILPECLGSLTSLESIHVDGCNNLVSLPKCLNSLMSQQILSIKNCPKLEIAAPIIGRSSVKSD